MLFISKTKYLTLFFRSETINKLNVDRKRETMHVLKYLYRHNRHTYTHKLQKGTQNHSHIVLIYGTHGQFITTKLSNNQLQSYSSEMAVTTRAPQRMATLSVPPRATRTAFITLYRYKFHSHANRKPR